MLFNKKNKYYNEKAYINFLSKIIVDKNIKEEISNQIEIFKEKGSLIFDGNNLYGKIIQKDGNDYLEIKYDNNHLTCNYTKWNNQNTVNISQVNLKNSNIKLYKKEKTEYICPSDENQTDILEIEKIYNKNNNLIYESNLKNNSTYNSFTNQIIYNDVNWRSNRLELDRKWYIKNGSIIKYNLVKVGFENTNDLKETYFICPKAYNNGFQTICHFDHLDPELFNKFMEGKISIEELIKQNSNINKTKKITQNNLSF